MNTRLSRFLPVAFILIALHSVSALAAPVDFAGIWETHSGWADEYEGWGAFHYTDCVVYAELKANDENFSIKDVTVKCRDASTGRILKQAMPAQDFSLDSNGNISGPTGSGRIVGNQIQLTLPDAYDGNHYVRFELKAGVLHLTWGYEGEEGSNFEISGGAKGLTKIETR